MHPVCQNSGTKYIFHLYNKALRSYLYMSAIAGQTAGPNGRKLFEGTLEYPGEQRLKSFFFQKKYFFLLQNYIFQKFHGQRRAFQLDLNNSKNIVSFMILGLKIFSSMSLNIFFCGKENK